MPMLRAVYEISATNVEIVRQSCREEPKAIAFAFTGEQRAG